jgi:hypothetical protein
MIKKFPASTVSSVAPPSAAAAAETSSLCDRVNVVISASKTAKRPGSKCSHRRNFLRSPNRPFRKPQGSLSATNLNLIQIKKLRTKSERLKKPNVTRKWRQMIAPDAALADHDDLIGEIFHHDD